MQDFAAQISWAPQLLCWFDLESPLLGHSAHPALELRAEKNHPAWFFLWKIITQWMGRSTISMAIFNSKLLNYQRVRNIRKPCFFLPNIIQSAEVSCKFFLKNHWCHRLFPGHLFYIMQAWRDEQEFHMWIGQWPTVQCGPPSDVCWFRFAPVTSSLFAYHKP